MTTVAIVCGYDLHSELSEYVRRLVPILEAARPDTIVLSGGRTSRHIDDSEANAMSVALAGHISHPNVILEESAMTTLDNIVFARSIARSNDVSRYIVICDHVHAAKVTLLSALLLRRNFRVHSVQAEGAAQDRFVRAGIARRGSVRRGVPDVPVHAAPFDDGPEADYRTVTTLSSARSRVSRRCSASPFS